MWIQWSGCKQWWIHHIDRCQDDGAPQLYNRRQCSVRVDSRRFLLFHHSTGLPLDQRASLPRQRWGWQLGGGIRCSHQSNQNHLTIKKIKRRSNHLFKIYISKHIRYLYLYRYKYKKSHQFFHHPQECLFHSICVRTQDCSFSSTIPCRRCLLCFEPSFVYHTQVHVFRRFHELC